MGPSGRRAVLALFGALGSLVLLPGCGMAGEALPTYRYRLTVEVETPEGIKSGFSVIEVRTTMAGRVKLPDANALAIDVVGEAVTVNLGKRGLLFALLRSEGFPGWAGGAMTLVTPRPPIPNAPGESRYVAWHAKMIANKGVHVLPRYAPHVQSPPGPPAKPGDPPSDYPMLVRFTDISDPKTVERVDPDNLAASFGAGVKLKRITVELTDDPVTTGIEKRLGWLPRVYQILKGSNFRPAGIPVGNFRGLFTTEEFQ
jgi:hypothetical protein